MKRVALVPIAIALMGIAPVLVAQSGGGGGPSQGPDRPSAPGSNRPEERGAERAERGRSAEEQRQDRERVRATEEQRRQIRTCSQTSERIRDQAREMERISKGREFDPDRARVQRDQIRTEARTLQQDHERFAGSLSEEQRPRLQEQVRSLERAREHLEMRLQQMDRMLGEGAPDARQVSEQARELQRATKEWQKQHRELAAEMSAR